MAELATVLVTGGARRLGRAIVKELVRFGAQVVFTYAHSQAEAQSLAEATEGRAIPVRCQLEDQASRQDLVAWLRDQFPRLTGLVHNAAVFYPTPLAQLTLESLRQVLAVNLEAPLFLSRDLAPLLAQASGAIVHITDIYAQLPLPGYTAYALSKAGLLALTRQLAAELAPAVRVNAVSPGIAAFPEDYDQATRERLIQRTLLKRPGSPEEIARAVRFLLFEAPTVTGQVLAVDAGRLLGPS